MYMHTYHKYKFVHLKLDAERYETDNYFMGMHLKMKGNV